MARGIYVSKELLQQLSTVLNSADADLQGAINREDLREDDMKAAKQTRKEIADVLLKVSNNLKLVTGRVK